VSELLFDNEQLFVTSAAEQTSYTWIKWSSKTIMFDLIHRWYQRKFSDPQAAALLFFLGLGFTVIYFWGNLIAPLLVAIVLAYLLDWPVSLLSRCGLRRGISSSVVLLLFVAIMTFALLRLAPTVWGQGLNLMKEMPVMLNKMQLWLNTLPENYPEFVNAALVDSFSTSVRQRLLGFGERALQASLASLINLAAIAVYCILVPLMVFFMLSDKITLVKSVTRFLPRDRKLLGQVWIEMNLQIMNYIRGKVIEILVVGVASYLVFAVMGLNYSALLAVLVGLSVLIPYIGAAAVTVPVTMVALFQWGFTAEFGYLMAAYGVVQTLDGNLLVPILFSEAVNLHPLAIVVAVLFFGGLWGFWGVFFAIPLATLVKAVINVWPHDEVDGEPVLLSQ
jgi:putative permease